jgi:hypothetical protein
MDNEEFNEWKFKSIADNLMIAQNPDFLITAIVGSLCVNCEPAYHYLRSYAVLDPKTLGILKGRHFGDVITSASKQVRSLFSRAL